MLLSYILMSVLFGVSVFLFLIKRTQQATEKSLILKSFASLMFVAIGALSLLKINDTPTKALVCLGMVCGLIGDIILDLKVMYPEKSKTYFNFGTLMFGVGHVLYFMSIVLYIQNQVVTGFGWVALSSLLFAIVISILIVKFSPKMKLDMLGYKTQCILYSTLLVFMALITTVLAICGIKLCWILASGFVLFFVSDLILSMQYFGNKEQNKAMIIANHVLYYVAQLLIASWIFFI